MYDSGKPKESQQTRLKSQQKTTGVSSLDGRVKAAAAVPARTRQTTGGGAGGGESNVLLIVTGGTVPPETPYGTIIVEDATGLYTG